MCSFQFLLILNILSWFGLCHFPISGINLPTRLDQCLLLPAKQDFNFEKYQGKWYVIKALLEPGGYKIDDCTYLDYRDVGGDRHYEFEDKFNYKYISGLIRQLRDNGNFPHCARLEGDFSLSSPSPLTGQIITKDYSYRWFVLDTNYATYSIDWTCYTDSSQPGIQTQSVWVYARERDFYCQWTEDKIHRTLVDLGFSLSDFYEINQTNCTRAIRRN